MEIDFNRRENIDIILECKLLQIGFPSSFYISKLKILTRVTQRIPECSSLRVTDFLQLGFICFKIYLLDRVTERER